MSEKSLGQIAFEAFEAEAINPIRWNDVNQEKWRRHWERAAQAVKQEVFNGDKQIENDQNHWRAGYERGAAEERERLAKPEEMARQFHEIYERLAPLHGYETRSESRVPWDTLPLRNRQLMIDTCAEWLRAGGKP